MTKKETREAAALAKKKYPSYRAGELAAQLMLHGVDEADIAYIMQGGERIGITPYDEAQAWLAQAMNRLAERVPPEKAVAIRRAKPCCLGGAREKLAKEICAEHPTVDARFEALAQARLIIGGKAWKENGDYYISYWYDKPVGGYTCSCLRHVPESEPMNKLWCECCAAHIKRHFETALGAKATCRCCSSALSSCGEKPCLFRFHLEGGGDDVRADAR